MFVGICLYYFLFFPVKTATLVGSSAHWKAEDFVEVQILDNGWHAISMDELKVWWTGTPGEATQVQYEIAGLHGTIAKGTESGPFYPWVTDNTNSSLVTNEQIKYGLFLTITWNGKSETVHLQRR